MNNNNIAKYLLRVGLAFVLVYASVEIYLHPANFLKYIPQMLVSMLPVDLFLDSLGVIEVALAAWLLTGWKGEIPSFLTFLMMVGIIVFNPEHFQVLFRNVAIAFAGLALILLERARTPAQSH